MTCSCSDNDKCEVEVSDMVDLAGRFIRSASDPFSAVIKFLHDRPEQVSLAGPSVKQVLLKSFGSGEQIPGLIGLLSKHVREIVRQSNVIAIYNEHLAQEHWGGHLIKLKEQVRFEVSKENNQLALKNIAGLICVQHGMELPLEKILVNPPKLEITVKLGLLRPVIAVDIV